MSTSNCIFVVQDVLLFLNLFLFAWYLKETIKTRHTAERQVTVSQGQVEAQIKPALIARLPDNSQLVELVNIGSGPALHIELKSVLKGSISTQISTGLGPNRIAFVEPHQTQITHVRTREPEIPGKNTFLLESSSRSLKCEYRSLSGRVYFTIVDFDHSGSFVENTHFGECEPPRVTN